MPWSPGNRQWQLDVVIPAFIAVDEVLQEERNVTLLQVAALPQHLGDIGGYVLRPVFGGVEGDDADRVLILPLQQVEDDGFEIGPFEVSFRPDTAGAAQIIS